MRHGRVERKDSIRVAPTVGPADIRTRWSSCCPCVSSVGPLEAVKGSRTGRSEFNQNWELEGRKGCGCEGRPRRVGWSLRELRLDGADEQGEAEGQGAG